MAAETVSNKVELLKKLWGDKVAAPGFKRSKFVMNAKKNTDFVGELRFVVVTNSPLTGASADFATAVANEGAGVEKRFSVFRKPEYVTFSIANELYLAAETKGKGALVEIMKQKSEQALYKHGRAAAARAWGNGGGSIGRIDATTTIGSNVLILDNPLDHTRFEVGMKLQLAADDGTPASPAGVLTGTITVVSITRGNVEDGSTLTLSGNITAGIASAATGNYIFRQGDYGVAMTGVPGWNPTTAPSASESFFGVDRTVGDVQRSIGYIAPVGASTTYQQKLVRALMAGSAAGVVDINSCYVNPIKWGEIALEVAANQRVMVENKTYGISFETLRVNGPDGPVSIYSEPDVPDGFYWMNDSNSYELFSLGGFPREITDTGNKWITLKEGVDEWRGRLGSYANFLNENPGNSIQGAF
jgi:hypothetical protein